MQTLPRTSTLLLLAGLVVTLVSCFDFSRRPVPPPPEQIFEEAYVPVYGTDPAKRTISATTAQPTEAAGKIYVAGKRLYQVEKYKGIHVIDYTDREHPQKMAFINIPGCTEVAVKSNVLFTNNMMDLVTVDISDLSVVKELSRTPTAFEVEYYFNGLAMDAKPEQRNVHYVCPNPYSGDVIEWKLEKKVAGAYCITQ
ncbi:hypothetical protein [Flavihumibacter petaseus]|uniref:Uncharacterized protein n=1 Tax=Flavihumibacter petaseus NBRC 106054 TaxID=1220578 RepID=A0A0E9MUB5_9BACT|nr:hypothetical protein [Flavihumibacter petaseus]GAO41068.1 hypothetical protein FPE01S_01_00800 [Flavihumibacter petaseus NBRC 106054]